MGLAISRGLGGGSARSRRLGGRCNFPRAMQKIGGALRVRRGGEDRALVVLQRLDPRRDIGGMVLAKLRRQVEVGGQERGTKLRSLS